MMCPNVATLLQPISPKLHYLLTGTFNTVFLYLLAFNPVTSSLSIVERVKGEGPHQFFGLNQNRDRVYATTWGSPASLSAWNVIEGGRGGIEKINTVPITATSSYLHLSPNFPVIYSAGGPTGEVHSIDIATGGFGEKLQEMVYVDAADLAKADKTRVALRYGSHGVDLSIKNQAFVPHLGLNAIIMYDVKSDGTLEMTGEQESFGEGEPDGPRHVVPSPDGNTLYVVTEHSSYLDVYTILPSSLTHRQRLSVIPPEADAERLAYRGDTLRLSQSGDYLYVTTRGKTTATKGYVTTWAVNPDGSVGSTEASTENDPTPPIERYQTKNSGGKANAIEAFPFHQISESKATEKEVRDWIVLTDDEEGWIWMLEWNGKNMIEIASVKLGVDEGKDSGFVGASHAVWLS